MLRAVFCDLVLFPESDNWRRGTGAQEPWWVERGPTSNIRHKDFRTLSRLCNAQGTPPVFWNGLDWRSLVELRILNIGKTKRIAFLFLGNKKNLKFLRNFLLSKKMLFSSFFNIRNIVFDQSSPVKPISESRGGPLSMTQEGGRKISCLILKEIEIYDSRKYTKCCKRQGEDTRPSPLSSCSRWRARTLSTTSSCWPCPGAHLTCWPSSSSSSPYSTASRWLSHRRHIQLPVPAKEPSAPWPACG